MVAGTSLLLCDAPYHNVVWLYKGFAVAKMQKVTWAPQLKIRDSLYGYKTIFTYFSWS